MSQTPWDVSRYRVGDSVTVQNTVGQQFNVRILETKEVKGAVPQHFVQAEHGTCGWVLESDILRKAQP